MASSPRNHLNHNIRSGSVPTQRELAEKALARRRASFIGDWRAYSRPLTSHEIAQVLEAAERLEVRRKGRGRCNGPLTRIGLIVLRALATRFLNRRSGLCCPSYRAIREATGLCQQSVAVAIACLERAGILTVTRRLRRQQVERVNGMSGLHECYSGVVQDTSLYILSRPGAWGEHLAVPNTQRAPFPAPRQLALLQTGRLTWRVQPSLGDREKPLHPPIQPGPRPLAEAIDALRASVERAPRARFSREVRRVVGASPYTQRPGLGLGTFSRGRAGRSHAQYAEGVK